MGQQQGDAGEMISFYLVPKLLLGNKMGILMSADRWTPPRRWSPSFKVHTLKDVVEVISYRVFNYTLQGVGDVKYRLYGVGFITFLINFQINLLFCSIYKLKCRKYIGRK
jgi:hypothetical protein